MIMQAYDFYAARELDMVLDYFDRKGRGDVSVPVPSLSVFDHVAGSATGGMALATFVERELRALYLGVGRPVSREQAAELMESWESEGATAIARQISDLESEIEAKESELSNLRDEMHELKAGGVEPEMYLPEDLMPVIGELQREGA